MSLSNLSKQISTILVVKNDQTVASMLAVSLKYGVSSVELFIEYAPNRPPLNN